MIKLIKELFSLHKTIKDKQKLIFELDNNINNKEELKEQIKNEARQEAKKEATEIVSNAKEELARIKEEISKQNQYVQQIEEIKGEYDKISKKVSKEHKKLSKINSIYDRIQYLVKKYEEYDIFNENVSNLILTDNEYNDYLELNPTIELRLHSMDFKELKKAYNINEKLIKETFIRYEGRYTTKANVAIYKLMVIALKAEQQNILSNLKYDKIDKSIEDIKKTTDKYLVIAGEGNKSILNTITKFVNEIEYMFIKSMEIEYEYYINKERAKEEQARLREQMRQENEERKILEQQKKQVEKEEEKYINEITKVKEMLILTEDEEKLKQFQAKILELQTLLELVEHKKDDITKLQNGKAGYVYIISNIGSFGDEVFKVGMTRRLNPQDRVDELGDASVPFYFDVHSFIFSDNAVGLEQKLHSLLDKQRVNKINSRKEFFNVSIDELEKLVQEIEPSTEFNKTMIAEQYIGKQFQLMRRWSI